MIGDKLKRPISSMYFISDPKLEKQVLKIECLCLAISTLDKTGEGTQTIAETNKIVKILISELEAF